MLSLSTDYEKMTNNIATISLSVTLLAAFALSATGCSTTPTFKPTASVMVGAHKSL